MKKPQALPGAFVSSDPMAIKGSERAARIDGNTQARSATVSRSRQLPSKIHGSPGVTPIRKLWIAR